MIEKLNKVLNKSDIFFPLILFFLIFLIFSGVFFNSSFFSFIEDDSFTVFNNLFNEESSWKYKKGFGTTFNLGDPSNYYFSLIPSIFKLIANENKLTYYNFFLIFFNFLNSLGIFYLLSHAIPRHNKFLLLILSITIVFSTIRVELLFNTQWGLMPFSLAVTTIILNNFLLSDNKKYILNYFLIIFLVFNLTSIVVITQTLIFNFIFFLLFSVYYKKFKFFNYLKLIIFTLFFLILSNIYLFYPYFENIFTNELLRSSTSYYDFKLINIDGLIQLPYKIIHLLFNDFFNQSYQLPDKGLLPKWSWLSPAVVVFTPIFFIIFKERHKNFWLFYSINAIILYYLYSFLVHIFPSLDLIVIFLKTYPFQKIYLELQILFLILFSYYLLNIDNFNFGKKIKIYLNILIIVYSIYFIYVFDILFNFNFFNKILIFIEDIFFLEKNLIINIIITINDKIKYNFDKNLLLYIGLSLSFLIGIRFQNNLRRKNKIVLFVTLFFVCTLFKANHFVKLEKNQSDLWSNFPKSFAVDNFSRFAMVQEHNFLSNYKKIEYSFEGLEKWKNIYSDKNLERLSKCKKNFYNLRQPPFRSLSNQASFIPYSVGKNFEYAYPKQSHKDSQLGVRFEDYSFYYNTSINYIYTISITNTEYEVPNFLKLIWQNDCLKVYKIIPEPLPFYYLASKIELYKNDIYKRKFNSNTAYLDNNYYEKYKNLKLSKGEIKLINFKNNNYKFNFKSEFDSILILSESYHGQWKVKSNKVNNIFLSNGQFIGVHLIPGDYEFEIYFKEKSILILQILSIFFLFLSFFFIKINFKKF